MTPNEKEVIANKEFNQSVDFSHITDAYFRDKLVKGFVKFAPYEWTEMDAMEENALA